MRDLWIDSSSLEDAARRIDQVVWHFERAHGNAVEAAQAVGHTGLARKVVNFSDSWDIKRSKLIDALIRLAESYRAVATTMRELDSQIAQQLRDAAASAQANAEQAKAAMRAEVIGGVLPPKIVAPAMSKKAN